MKKLLSLCLALCLCLGLLPVTALAAAPSGQVIYVGDENVTSGGYWTTDSDGSVTPTGEDTPTDNYIHYDAENNVLTLHNATIKKSVPSTTSTYVMGAAIGVFHQSGNAELTIALEGTNTIAEVNMGIYVLTHSQSTGSSSLTITGDGSLDASGSQSGIQVQSNGGGATLEINSAEVKAVGGTSTGYSGVLVQAKNSSNVSLTVDGGNLTASGNTGINFWFGSSTSGSGTPTVTVSNSAIVRASGNAGGISDNSSADLEVGADSNGGGGIIFDNGTGTVYGDVTLQESLTIGEGESLTIPDGASLDTNGKTLTVNGGELTGNIPQSGVVYKVTEVTLDKGSLTLDEDSIATLTATITPSNATDQTVTWSSGTSGIVTIVPSTDTKTATVTATGTGTTTITATVDGKSAQCTVTVNAAETVQVESVSLNKATLELTEGGTETLTPTITPDNASNKAVTWSSDNESVATVEKGKVTAVSTGTAIITATAADGSGEKATCKVTVTAPSEPEPEPTPPYIPPTPSKTPSQQALEGIEDAQPGDTVTITLRPGQTTLEGEVLETLAGKDVTLVLRLTNGAAWTIKGRDVPTDTSFADTDFGVDLNTSGIDVDVINAVTGEVSSVQITLAHDGAFGFTLTLTPPLGRKNAGYWANLYHYIENEETLNYETSAQITEDGTAALRMTHASQYAIVIDEQSHELPFTDLGEGQWYESAVRYAYLNGIMEGMSGTIFQPNGTLSRAMAVQILYNLEGQPDISDENLGYPYSDVDADSWYGNAVYWARITGVAEGDGDGTFRPTDSITRQEFAQVLYNYASYKGLDLTANGDLSTFPDSGNIAGWAETAISWANGNKLINGHDDGTIDPKGTTTRAQAASLLMKFDQNLIEK